VDARDKGLATGLACSRERFEEALQLIAGPRRCRPWRKPASESCRTVAINVGGGGADCGRRRPELRPEMKSQILLTATSDLVTLGTIHSNAMYMRPAVERRRAYDEQA